MSKERALLKEVLYVIGEYTEDAQERTEILIAEIEKLLAQLEQEPVTDKPTEIAMAIMPNGVCVNDAYEEGRKSVMSEQKPVAWMYEWVNEIGEPVKSIVYNFYEDSNLIPLYAGSPTCEPLSDEKLEIMYSKHAFAMDKQEYMWGFRDAEKEHGIGGGE